MHKQGSKRGKLVKIWEERVPVEKLREPEYLEQMPSSKTRGCGIYALFNGKRLYYLGLTNRSLRWRIRKHTRDSHKGKWTHFSFYQIRRAKYTKDMETILLRIIQPPGNKIKGRFPSRQRLSTKMKEQAKSE
jgi:hypothetical protein